MRRIFISYSRTDQEFVKELARFLKKAYDHVWFDENLQGGQIWWEEILKQIDGCDVFVFLLSSHSLESVYCTKELDEARRLEKHVIPILIHKEIEIPERLDQLQTINMMDGINAESLSNLYATLIRMSTRIQQTEEEIIKERGDLLALLRSRLNNEARLAAEKLRLRGWLFDGSLQAADLEGANLEEAGLENSDLRKANLKRGNFQGAFLMEAKLDEAVFQEANLIRAAMQGASMRKANLQSANLRSAGLRQVDLREANLSNAIMRRTRLWNADLRGANLKGAILQAAVLGDAIFDEETTLPDGTYWSKNIDMRRFTESDHPEFWQPGIGISSISDEKTGLEVRFAHPRQSDQMFTAEIVEQCTGSQALMGLMVGDAQGSFIDPPPAGRQYELIVSRTGVQISPNMTFDEAGVKDGDVIEVRLAGQGA